MPLETIAWTNGTVRYIDQTRLPQELRIVSCRDVKTLWRAIKDLKVRGAPAIGIAGALGMALTAARFTGTRRDRLLKALRFSAAYLGTSRPTAVNLFWALERVRAAAARCPKDASVAVIREAVIAEAISIMEEDKKRCRAIGRTGAVLVRNGDRILTHCNAGALATADYGTALGVLYRAQEEGKRFSVYAGETRPLLQGARLTAWELTRAGIDVTLICDDMAASLMREKKITKVFVGADRIAANGDTANKIGTYGIAALAHLHAVPFYVVAPTSTVDRSLPDGSSIPIEQRDPSEVRMIAGRYSAPRGVRVYNPAFDMTPSRFITAIITEQGICRPPFRRSIAQACRRAA